jgi:hypothetical protein
MKKINDFAWKEILKENNSLEESVKKINHPMIKESVKDQIKADLIVKFTDELENQKIRDRLE